jgi:hypothetical protein
MVVLAWVFWGVVYNFGKHTSVNWYGVTGAWNDQKKDTPLWEFMGIKAIIRVRATMSNFIEPCGVSI